VTVKTCRPSAGLPLVSRPRLLDLLNAGLRRPLTLLSAPAGFGKTALLIDWIESLERPVAWLSLDQNESKPRRFWTYVIAALRTVAPAVGEPALAALLSPRLPAIETLVTILSNDIADVGQ